MSEVKICSKCLIIKNLSEYYKSGKYFQKLCKICHNKRGCTYYKTGARAKNKKKTGFNKLSEETQDNIKADIYCKINYKKIAKTYGICYITLLNWKKKGIPAHIPISCENQ